MYMWRWASRTVRTSPVRSSGNSGCRREGWQLHVHVADVECDDGRLAVLARGQVEQTIAAHYGIVYILIAAFGNLIS